MIENTLDKLDQMILIVIVIGVSRYIVNYMGFEVAVVALLTLILLQDEMARIATKYDKDHETS